MSARLTDADRRDRAVTEAELQSMVTDLASLYGWQWVHFRPGLRANGRWYVPVEGPLGPGWPDLVLVHPGRRRLVFAELKRETGTLTPGQRAIQETLATAAVEYVVWRPSDLSAGRIQAILATEGGAA